MTSSSIGVLRKALATSVVKTVNCLMMAIVSRKCFAIDEGVAANVCVSVLWMNCEKPLPQKRHLMSFVPLLVGRCAITHLVATTC
eukprot:4949874-Amphidinium_carterae.1